MTYDLPIHVRIQADTPQEVRELAEAISVLVATDEYIGPSVLAVESLTPREKHERVPA